MIQDSLSTGEQGQVHKELSEMEDRLDMLKEWIDLPPRAITPAMWEVLRLDDGVDKLTAVSTYLQAEGWIAASVCLDDFEDMGLFKGGNLLFVGNTGILVYQSREQGWEKAGWFGYTKPLDIPTYC